MRRTPVALIVVVLALLALVASCAAPSNPWRDLVKKAAAENKPLVVEFYATWCKPCRHFEEKILPDPRVQAALVGLEFVRYDVDSPSGSDAYRRCGGKALPMVVGVDREGRIRLLKTGTELGADEFLSFLAQARRVLGP
jgi:thioredoxin:protein disulfide reductase